MKKINIIAEGGIMLALATALSFIRIVQFPWGGAVTLISMLPIMVFAIRHGVLKGLVVSFLFSLISFGQGIMIDGLLGWGLTPGLLVATILLDYIFAFTVLAVSGIFGKTSLVRIIGGISLSVALRFVLHVFSGVFVFESVGLIWNWNIENSWLYSMLYNALFLVPELAMTLVGAVVMFEIPGVRKIMFNS